MVKLKKMSIAEQLGNILREQKLSIAVAESCTGGLICKLITDVAGSSEYFDRGFITYSNKSKIETLGVPAEVIHKHGAVSNECAEAMARQVKKLTGCGVCLSTTGIAGPGGGTVEKPVGLVYAGFYIMDNLTVKRLLLKGTREQIREQTADYCLQFVINKLTGS